MGLSTSFLCRCVVKIMVDWTACVHFRSANEVGGVYFCFTMLLSVGIGVLSVALSDDRGQIVAMAIACFCFAVFFAAFLVSIGSKYRRTFLDNKTGCELWTSRFVNGEGDKEKVRKNEELSDELRSRNSALNADASVRSVAAANNARLFRSL